MNEVLLAVMKEEEYRKLCSSGLCSGLLYPEMLGDTCPLMLCHISEDMYLQLNHYVRTSGLTNF